MELQGSWGPSKRGLPLSPPPFGEYAMESSDPSAKSTSSVSSLHSITQIKTEDFGLTPKLIRALYLVRSAAEKIFVTQVNITPLKDSLNCSAENSSRVVISDVVRQTTIMQGLVWYDKLS